MFGYFHLNKRVSDMATEFQREGYVRGYMVSPTKFEILTEYWIDLTAFLERPPCRAYRPTPLLFGSQ